MTLNECAIAMRDGKQVRYNGGNPATIANLTKKGMVQLVYRGDRRPRVGVDPAKCELV